MHIKRFRKLRDIIHTTNGSMVVAHPFRSFILPELLDPQPVLDDACAKQVFQVVEAIEVCNGKSTEKENDLAHEVSARLQVKGVGGSDAHYIQEIGRCVTFFENNITSEEQLAAELKSGRFKAGYFRK